MSGINWKTGSLTQTGGKAYKKIKFIVRIFTWALTHANDDGLLTGRNTTLTGRSLEVDMNAGTVLASVIE